MTELGQDTFANMLTVIVAVSTSVAMNWSQVRGQTKQLKRMLRAIKGQSHADLEAIRLRVASLEESMAELKCVTNRTDKEVHRTGGDPETGHLPPTPGGQCPPLA